MDLRWWISVALCSILTACATDGGSRVESAEKRAEVSRVPAEPQAGENSEPNPETPNPEVRPSPEVRPNPELRPNREVAPNKAEGFWEEDSEEDAEASDLLEQALIKISFALKRGQILTFGRRSPTCVHLAQDEKKGWTVDIHEISSKPGETPIQKGEKLESHRLPPGVVLGDSARCFWFDLQGSIDFEGPDRTLRVFENPPQGDIVVFPSNPAIPRRGVIDITKQGAQLTYHQFLLQSNR